MSIALIPQIKPQVKLQSKPDFNYRFLEGASMLGHSPGMTPNILGKRITLRLADMKKTQSWLAAAMDLSNTAISKWIGGASEPSFSNLITMATHLQCSIGYLCGDENDEDIAAVTEMMLAMPKEKRGDIRKISSSLLEPDDSPEPPRPVSADAGAGRRKLPKPRSSGDSAPDVRSSSKRAR